MSKVGSSTSKTRTSSSRSAKGLSGKGAAKVGGGGKTGKAGKVKSGLGKVAGGKSMKSGKTKSLKGKTGKHKSEKAGEMSNPFKQLGNFLGNVLGGGEGPKGVKSSSGRKSGSSKTHGTGKSHSNTGKTQGTGKRHSNAGKTDKAGKSSNTGKAQGTNKKHPDAGKTHSPRKNDPAKDKTSARTDAPAGDGKVNLKPGGAWGGTQGPVQSLAKLAEGEGLHVSSAKRGRKSTKSGGVSDHWTGNKNSYANDYGWGGKRPTAKSDAAASKIVAALGGPADWGKKGGNFKTVVNGIRYQVIYRSNVGGNHFNHIHVGAKRVGE